MNLHKANLGQLHYLARFTKYRNDALLELDRRLRGFTKIQLLGVGKHD